MEEKSAVTLLLVLAAFGIAINAASIFIFADATPEVISNYVLPAACFKENSTYILSMPTNLEFCRRIADISNSVQPSTFSTWCETLTGEDKSKCLQVSGVFGKRVNDCMKLTYDTDLIKKFVSDPSNALKSTKSSVSSEELDKICGN